MTPFYRPPRPTSSDADGSAREPPSNPRSLLNASPHLASTLKSAISSALVSPTVRRPTHLPASRARRTRRYALKTCSDEPTTSSASALSTASFASIAISGLTLSPKNTTSGYRQTDRQTIMARGASTMNFKRVRRSIRWNCVSAISYHEGEAAHDTQGRGRTR